MVAVLCGLGVCQVLVSLPSPVPWEPLVLQLLVNTLFALTDPPPGVQDGADISVTGGGAEQNCDSQVLRTPC